MTHPSFIYIKLMLMALCWGGTFIAVRMLVPVVDPVTGSFLRFLVASAILATVVYWQEKHFPKVQLKHLPRIILLGSLGVFGYNLLFFGGLALVEAGRGSIIIALNPVVTFLLASLVVRRLPHRLAVVGVLTSMSGAITVITEGQWGALFAGAVGRGELMLVGCVLCWASYAVLGKAIMKFYSPLVLTAYAVFAGTLLLFVAVLFQGTLIQGLTIPLIYWAPTFYLAFFGTVLGFIWFYQGVNQLGPAKASAFVNFVPMWAVVLGTLLLDEPVTSALLIGGPLVILGVILTNRFAKAG